MKFRAQAPSNIALIKYMGKTDPALNRPANPSLSYTLNHLQTIVELELLPESVTTDQWQPLEAPGLLPIELSAAGQTRFLKHLRFLKSEFGWNPSFLVRSANGFPADCGIASSASSFAALTEAFFEAWSNLTNQKKPDVRERADWSRRGSGSSGRSFFSPWATWEDEKIEPVPFPKFSELHHLVVIAADQKKSVSSSQAHLRVPSSLLFTGRVERAQKRYQDLRECLLGGDWPMAFQICWEEFWDMHALFETSRPPFSYMTPETIEVLNWARTRWESEGDGPLVTMDAGPNVHFLFREDQSAQAQNWLEHWRGRGFQILSSFTDRGLKRSLL